MPRAVAWLTLLGSCDVVRLEGRWPTVLAFKSLMLTHYRLGSGLPRCGNKQAKQLAEFVEDVTCGACRNAIQGKGGEQLFTSEHYAAQVSITRSRGGMVFHWRYNPSLLSSFKDAVPSTHRRWDEGLKGWFVAEESVAAAREIVDFHLGPKAWARVLSLLGLGLDAPPSVVLVAYLAKRPGLTTEAAVELDTSVELLSAYFGGDVLEKGRQELHGLGFDQKPPSPV